MLCVLNKFQSRPKLAQLDLARRSFRRLSPGITFFLLHTLQFYSIHGMPRNAEESSPSIAVPEHFPFLTVSKLQLQPNTGFCSRPPRCLLQPQTPKCAGIVWYVALYFGHDLVTLYFGHDLVGSRHAHMKLGASICRSLFRA